jgi:hypothetical protein
MSIPAVMGIATDVASLVLIRDRELSCDYNSTGGHIARLDCTAGSSLAPTLSTWERGRKAVAGTTPLAIYQETAI